MFLIHGIRRVQLAQYHLPGACPTCGADGGKRLLVLQPFVHLFWLPLFALPRRGRTICAECGDRVEHRKLPQPTRELFDALKREERTPAWTFLGSVLFLIVLPIFIHSMSANQERKADLLAEPAVGDVWTIKLGSKHYTLYRVEELSNDSIHLRMNTRDTTGGVVKLATLQRKALNDFKGGRVGYARSDIELLAKKGFIRSVRRDSL